MHPYLESNILKDHGPGDCWGWRGPTDNGYPFCNFGGQRFSARTLIYEIFHGKPRKGHSILLSCGNVTCLNPEHMNGPKALRIKNTSGKFGRSEPGVNTGRLRVIR